MPRPSSVENPEVQSSPAAIYRRLLGYVTPYWRAFAGAVLAMVVLASTDAGFAAVMKLITGAGFINRDPRLITWLPFMIMGIFAARIVTGFFATFGMTWIARRVIKDLRTAMFRQLLSLPAGFYDRNSSGVILSKLLYDVEQVANASSNAITVLIRDTLTVIALLSWMAYISWKLTLVFLLVAPPLAILVGYISRRFRRLARRIQNSMGDVSHVTEEALEANREIKIFGGQAYEAAQFEKANEYNRRQQMKLTATQAFSVPFIQFIVACAFALIVYMATAPSAQHSIGVDTFVSFMTAMVLLMQPTRRLTNINATLQQGIAAAQSVFHFLDQGREHDHGTRRLERARGEVQYRDVSFSYALDKGAVLTDIDLHIEPGQTVAFVGHSGAGKTTLVSLLPRFYELTGGQLLLDGHDVQSLRLDSLRAQIALVSQHVTLFNDTIAHNIAYGALGQVSEAEIVRAAEAAHAMEFIRDLPQGLETQVGENGVLLSGGQRQRLAIARALLKNAPILILDEATSALDTQAERHIQGALDALMRTRTTLVIAHRLSTIEGADLIVVLDQGRIVEQGRHADLLARKGAYAQLYRMQFGDTHVR